MSEKLLRIAIVAICEADTGPGGLVELHGNLADPVREWGDTGLGRRPITTLQVLPGRLYGGTGNAMTGSIRLVHWVGVAAGGLESDIADRLEQVLTVAALLEQGLDCLLHDYGRNDVSELTEQGGKALASTWKYRLKR